MLMKVVGLVAAWTLSVSAQNADSTSQISSPTSSPMADSTPSLRVFNDQTLALKEYGFGALGGVVSGALCFYIGSGLESAFMGSRAKNGTLEFTGIRYDHFHGAFYGGAAGLWLGSALTAYFVGAVDEEDGSTLWTLVGGATTTALAMGVASALGANDRIDWPALIPLATLPATGAMVSFNVSRYFRDKHRLEKTGTATGWQPPRFNLAYQDNAPAYRLDALRWTF
jgi:hypothetical protein